MTDPVPPRNSAMSVAASALKAQQSRMRVIAENIANAQSTALVAGGEPYRRQIPVFQAREIDGATGVSLAEVRPDMGDFRSEYDPSHPAADPTTGYVKTSNVSSLIEMADLREAQRAYEANLNVIESSRAMMLGVVSLLKA